VSKLKSVLTALRKEYGRSLPDINEAGVVHKIPLSSPQLNYVFGGGFPLGRIVELHGMRSGGKSVLSSYIGGQIQKRTDGGPSTVLYVDSEYTFDIQYAKTVGLDTTPIEENGKLMFMQPQHGEEAFTMVENAVKTGEVGLVIWDSVNTTATRGAMEDEFGKRSFGGAGLLFSEGLKKLNPHLARHNCSMILLRQMRASIGGGPHGPTEEASGGGYAPEFYASWMAGVSRVDDIKDKDVVIGNSIRIRNNKSKIGFPKRIAEMRLMYASGFSPDSEYIDFIVDLGLVKKAGAWFSNEEWGFKGQGRDSLLDFLCNNPEIFNKMKNIVNESFTRHSILDSREEVNEED